MLWKFMIMVMHGMMPVSTLCPYKGNKCIEMLPVLWLQKKGKLGSILWSQKDRKRYPVLWSQKHGNFAQFRSHKSMGKCPILWSQKPEAMHHFMATKTWKHYPILWSQKHGSFAPFYDHKAWKYCPVLWSPKYGNCPILWSQKPEAMLHFMATKTWKLPHFIIIIDKFCIALLSGVLQLTALYNILHSHGHKSLENVSHFMITKHEKLPYFMVTKTWQLYTINFCTCVNIIWSKVSCYCVNEIGQSIKLALYHELYNINCDVST